MGPAIRVFQMFQFTGNLVILGKTIGNQNTLKVLIVLFGMVTVACFLVFIHNDLWIRAQLTGKMHPHVAFAARRAAIMDYFQSGFVTLVDMRLQLSCFHVFINGSKISLSRPYRPVGHGQFG